LNALHENGRFSVRSTLALLPGKMEQKMGWPSCVDSIDAIRCDLEHLTGSSCNQVKLDASAAPAVLAAAERLMREIWTIIEIATDPSLEVAYEVARLRAVIVELKKRQNLDLCRIECLSSEATKRARETTFWRDQYYELSRRSQPVRRGRLPRRGR
jgi:hypothetical protein